jgi:RNA recognition motif-containing protein
MSPGEASPSTSSFGDTQSMEDGMEDDQRWFGHFDFQANARKIWIGGLGKETSEHQLRHWLTSFGAIEEMSLVRDETGISKGFAYVTFVDADSASSMIRSEPVQFGNRVLSVKPAIPKEIMNMNKIYVSSLPEAVTTGMILSFFSLYSHSLKTKFVCIFLSSEKSMKL